MTKIVCIGDSMTYGSNANNGIDTSKSYPSDLAALIPSATIYNKGVNGQQTGNMWLRFQTDVIDLDPDYVIILGGVNDLAAGGLWTLPATYITEMITLATENNINPVLCLLPPNSNWTTGDDKYTQRTLLNQWITTMAINNKFPLLDFFGILQDPGTPSQYLSTYTDDLLHPNAAGYSIMADYAYHVLFSTLSTSTSGFNLSPFNYSCFNRGPVVISNPYVVKAPVLYAVPASEIDQKTGGFDLPDPITFTWPDDSIIEKPTIVGAPEEKYNKVTVYGVLTSTGETTVASVYTPSVYKIEEKPKEYIVQDNSIEEKGSTAEIEAIKWLLYFSTPRATVTMRLVNRFDLELYQRIKFGAGFDLKIRELTNSVQLPYVVAYDPRSEETTVHNVDVSGVPRPSWLRISEVKNHSAVTNGVREETCETKLITDFIYSSVDPIVQEPYNLFISPGYFKPVSDDSASTIQSIVDTTVKKQATVESGTVLSLIDTVYASVLTASGKTLKVRSQSAQGTVIIILPDGKGGFYGATPG